MEILILIVAVVIVYWQTARLAALHAIPAKFLALMAVEHAFATYFYRTSLEGDWVKYYQDGQYYAASGANFDYFEFGTQFIVAISHFLQSIATFSVGGMFCLFSLCGFLGQVYFLCACRPLLRLPKDRYWLGIFLLPGIHIWTCAIGKDALVFLPLCHLLYSFSFKRYTTVPVAFSLGLMFLIRPHVAFFAMAAIFGASTFAREQGKISGRAMRILIMCGAIVAVVPSVQEYSNIESTTFEAATTRIDIAANSNQKGGGSVDITQYSPPVRILTFMFRPLFYDATNLLGLLASGENLFMLLFCATLLNTRHITILTNHGTFAVIYSIMFAGIMSIILGMSTANLGLALRQKTQILPYFYYLVLYLRHARSVADLRPRATTPVPAHLSVQGLENRAGTNGAQYRRIRI